MEHLNDLPKRGNNHKIESKAEAAFQAFLAHSSDFIVQTKDRKDYGTDHQIEVIDLERATNIRLHVQLKGTEKSLNSDGTISIEVNRANLNYLEMQPHSFYVCYHVPTDSLWICFADSVLRNYEHSGKNWVEQTSLTVKFIEPLTEERLKQVVALAKAGAISVRDKRVLQATASVSEVPKIIKRALPDLHVPEDSTLAANLLSSLYDHGADEQISANFEKFASIWGATSDEMITCYMAEINRGMAGICAHPERIEAGILLLESRLDLGKYQVGSLYYSIGNALSALGREKDAIAAYQSGVENTNADEAPDLLAQCYKNLGSSFERLGEVKDAVEYYRRALNCDPNLAEAHFALGNHHHRSGEFEEALNHFDATVFPDGTLGKMSSIAGWRVNILFNLDDGRGAFREINNLLSDADNEAWIWPWCARQVANFGRTSVQNARASVTFWARYTDANPDTSSALQQSLLVKLYLRSNGEVLNVIEN